MLHHCLEVTRYGFTTTDADRRSYSAPRGRILRARIQPSIAHHPHVLPEKLENVALNFAKRVRTDFREYLKEHSVLRYLPTVDFALDLGEKNRQRIDELTRK